jgi:hypothetical protein
MIALVVAQMRILDNHLQDENGELVLQGKTLLVGNARGKALQRPVHIQDHLIVLAVLGQLRQERSLVQTVRVDFQQQRPYSAPQIICQNETFTSLSQSRRALPPTSPNGSIAKSCHVFSVELLLLRACSINSRFFRSAADSSSARARVYTRKTLTTIVTSVELQFRPGVFVFVELGRPLELTGRTVVQQRGGLLVETARLVLLRLHYDQDHCLCLGNYIDKVEKTEF